MSVTNSIPEATLDKDKTPYENLHVPSRSSIYHFVRNYVDQILNSCHYYTFEDYLRNSNNHQGVNAASASASLEDTWIGSTILSQNLC